MKNTFFIYIYIYISKHKHILYMTSSSRSHRQPWFCSLRFVALMELQNVARSFEVSVRNQVFPGSSLPVLCAGIVHWGYCSMPRRNSKQWCQKCSQNNKNLGQEGPKCIQNRLKGGLGRFWWPLGGKLVQGVLWVGRGGGAYRRVWRHLGATGPGRGGMLICTGFWRVPEVCIFREINIKW